MRFKLVFVLAVLALAALLPWSTASAQTTPPDQVTLFLAKQGYAVLAVGNYPDANGNPDPRAVYVLMNVLNRNLDSQDTALEATWGFAAIRNFYPDAMTLISALRDNQFLVMFYTEQPTFDRFVKQELPAQDFWQAVRSNVRIFDTNKNAIVSEKDFTGGSQTNKNYTNTTFTPSSSTCGAPANEAYLMIQNSYIGQLMRFTIGGGDWGTHDYDVPGDAQRYIIKMPPGKYTYTAHIAGTGTAHGEPFQYNGGNCYPLTFSP